MNYRHILRRTKDGFLSAKLAVRAKHDPRAAPWNCVKGTLSLGDEIQLLHADSW